MSRFPQPREYPVSSWRVLTQYFRKIARFSKQDLAFLVPGGKVSGACNFSVPGRYRSKRPETPGAPTGAPVRDEAMKALVKKKIMQPG